MDLCFCLVFGFLRECTFDVDLFLGACFGVATKKLMSTNSLICSLLTTHPDSRTCRHCSVERVAKVNVATEDAPSRQTLPHDVVECADCLMEILAHTSSHAKCVSFLSMGGGNKKVAHIWPCNWQTQSLCVCLLRCVPRGTWNTCIFGPHGSHTVLLCLCSSCLHGHSRRGS